MVWCEFSQKMVISLDTRAKNISKKQYFIQKHVKDTFLGNGLYTES